MVYVGRLTPHVTPNDTAPGLGTAFNRETGGAVGGEGVPPDGQTRTIGAPGDRATIMHALDLGGRISVMRAQNVQPGQTAQTAQSQPLLLPWVEGKVYSTRDLEAELANWVPDGTPTTTIQQLAKTIKGYNAALMTQFGHIPTELVGDPKVGFYLNDAGDVFIKIFGPPDGTGHLTILKNGEFYKTE
jgi:hypothetical protein